MKKLFNKGNLNFIVLLGILIAAFIIRLVNLNFNSPFLDEAIYVMRGLSILSGNIGENIDAISWIGGFPFFYPLLSGIAFDVGGILGARFLSIIFGTVSVYLVYVFTKQLLLFKNEKLNQFAGLSAGALMATTSVAITSSRLAIYDGLSFMLFLVGLVLWHKALYTGERKRYVQAAVSLFLSFIAKYSVMIFFPFLVVLPLYLAIKRKNKTAINGVFRDFGLTLSLLTFGYIALNFSNLQQFFTEQAIGASGSALEVLQIFSAPLAWPFILALAGTLFFWKSRQLLVILLLGLSVIPLAVHIATNNTMTAQQQTFLSLIFLLPIAGGFFAKLAQKNKWLATGAVIIAVAINSYLSIPQISDAESFWSNSDGAVAKIHQEISANDRILSEGGDVFALGLRDKIGQDKVTGPFVFEYAGQEGTPAYLAAIKDGYFNYIQLEGTYFDEEAVAAIKAQLEQSNYTKVYEEDAMVVYKKP